MVDIKTDNVDVKCVLVFIRFHEKDKMKLIPLKGGSKIYLLNREFAVL